MFFVIASLISIEMTGIDNFPSLILGKSPTSSQCLSLLSLTHSYGSKHTVVRPPETTVPAAHHDLVKRNRGPS